VLRFGLDALGAVTRFSTEQGAPIKAQAGQHIGGSAFVGVIGTVLDSDAMIPPENIMRPTFEVLGQAVAVALDLVDRKGIPGKLIVTRAVYLLIDRAQFAIVERSAFVEGHASTLEEATYVVSVRT
jgi:hypothetical protein